MTATASEARTADVPVDVRFTAAGTPLAVRYDGRVWAVVAEPVHWFDRCAWWNTGHRAPVGAGDLVSVEHWRVQVRLSAAAQLRTFHLQRFPNSPDWQLTNITDGR